MTTFIHCTVSEICEYLNRTLPMADAPKDGTEISLPIITSARAYWDHELNRWILSTPLHIESVTNAFGWRP